jgi:hypothetical protein
VVQKWWDAYRVRIETLCRPQQMVIRAQPIQVL